MAIGSLPTAYGAVTKWDRPEMQETRVRSLAWEDPLEEGMATHSSVLAWSIPWQRSLVGCSPRGHTESDMTEAPEHGPGPGGGTSQQEATSQAEVGVAATLGSDRNRFPPESSHSGPLISFLLPRPQLPPRAVDELR